MNPEKISVIVPIYNVERYLHQCVDSIIAQRYDNLEIILVDDGSTDGCGIICDEYAKQDCRIRVIHKVNARASAARNAGLDIVSGEYVGFVDSDDYIDCEMYSTMHSALIRTGASISCTGIWRETETGSKKKVRCPQYETTYSPEEAIHAILRSNEMGVSVWSKLYRRSVFEKVRFPEVETNEDAVILFDFHSDQTVVHTGVHCYHYMVRGESTTSKYDAQAARTTWNNAKKIWSMQKNTCQT